MRFVWSSVPDRTTIVIYNCSQDPGQPEGATRNTPMLHITEVLSYHGSIDPMNGYVGCFLAGETKTIQFALRTSHIYHTVGRQLHQVGTPARSGPGR